MYYVFKSGLYSCNFVKIFLLLPLKFIIEIILACVNVSHVITMNPSYIQNNGTNSMHVIPENHANCMRGFSCPPGIALREC